MRISKRGMTLIELLIACGLAVILGSVAFNFIATSIQTHRRAQLGRLAQSGVRNLSGLLVAELRSSSTPPFSAFVPSPVFWPGIWGKNLEGAGFGTFYPRDESPDPEDANITHDWVRNRLFYVRKLEDAGALSANSDLLEGYSLVEIFVPVTQPNVLERRVYKLFPAADSALKQLAFTGADGRSHPGWIVDPVKVGVNPPAINDEDQRDILLDAGEGARISFRISHKTFTPADDPLHILNPEFFDPANFTIEVAVAYNPIDDLSEQEVYPSQEKWQVLRSESTELRIPAAKAD